MLVALQRVLRHALYGARGGFLVRPLVIAFVLGACGVLLPLAEQASGLVERLVVSGGHFALEEDGATIAHLIREFLAKRGIGAPTTP